MMKKIVTLVVFVLSGVAAPAWSQQVVRIEGQKSTNASTPTANRNLPVMPAIACAAAQSYTTGFVVFPCTNLFGYTGMFLTDPTTGAALAVAVDGTHDAAAVATGPQVMGECDDTSTDAVDEGDAGRVRIDCANRQLYVRHLDPCTGVAKTTDAFSVTTDTVIIAATSAKKNYICSLVVVAGAAEIVSITEGTGSTCGTSEAALVGSTTDANGMSFAANGGAAIVGGNSTAIAGKTANVDTCLNVSGSNRVSGFVTWVQAP